MDLQSIAKPSPIFSYDDLLTVLETVSDGIAVTDGDGKFLLLNEAYGKLMGSDRKEILGTNVKELVDKKYISKSVTLQVLEHKSVQSIIQSVKKTKKELLLTGSPIIDDNGQIKYVVAILRDITELIKLKQELNETLIQKNKYLNEIKRLKQFRFHKRIIFKSKAMQKIMYFAERVATFDSNVLVRGESGVGKELLVKYIHEMSSRNNGPFIAINCGAIPNTLIESELFGYDEGAFTGAKKGGKIGSFELSDKGTIFLDEVDALPFSVQVKLLRVLQDKLVTRLGSTIATPVDFRLIAAANSDIESMVRQGTFRKDLFFRLNVIPIEIPPLRERKEDIPYLVSHFLQIYNNRYKMEKKISPHVMKRFIAYSWPGNVRELENIVERITVTSLDDNITIMDLSNEHITSNNNYDFLSLKEHRKQAEKELLMDVSSKLNSTYKISKLLSVNQSTIVRKMKEYGIKLQKE